MRQAAGRCLRTVPGDADLAALDSLITRLAAFQMALSNPEQPAGEDDARPATVTPPASAPIAADEGCTVCQQMEQALTSHLFTSQFRLATREDEQERHTLGGGFCPLHTWQYAAVASPLGISAAYARLAASAAGALESLSDQDSPCAELAREVAGLIVEPGKCPVCEVLADRERTAIAGPSFRGRRRLPHCACGTWCWRCRRASMPGRAGCCCAGWLPGCAATARTCARSRSSARPTTAG